MSEDLTRITTEAFHGNLKRFLVSHINLISPEVSVRLLTQEAIITCWRLGANVAEKKVALKKAHQVIDQFEAIIDSYSRGKHVDTSNAIKKARPESVDAYQSRS